MKRTLTLILALLLVFSMALPLVACDFLNPKPEPEVPDHEHVYAKSAEKEATCTEPGTVTYTCDECGHSYTEQTAAALGHIDEDGDDVCDRCGVLFKGTAGSYTFRDSVSTLATNWNPHTYQTSDDSYPADFLRVGLYGFYFNDALHPIEGKDDYAGYVILPEMASELPIDITAELTPEEKEFYGIPADATKGYAYTINLNPLAKWENGDVINADTYVYSMKQLLDPDLKNYRATDYTTGGDFSIANGVNYAKQGDFSYIDNATNNGWEMADLTLGEDGIYYAPNGSKMMIGLNFPLAWLSGKTLKTYVDKYGADAFDVTNWPTLVAMMDGNGLVPLTEETYALFVPVITGNPEWGETDGSSIPYYFVEGVPYPVGYDFENVGIKKVGEYAFNLYLAKSLSGFYLLYNLSGNWIVHEGLYEANKVQTGDTWTSTYNTSPETTLSYGPYKMVGYKLDKDMTFVKNENWYGYSDGKHVYIDPEDGEQYDMYQTTKIYCQVVEEAATRREMFLKGQLMGYGLQTEDFATYRNSKRCYVTPSETIYFFIFNGYMDAIQNREKAEGFDQTKYDLETMTILDFRKAIAVTYDKEALCDAVSPSRSGGYGLIGNMYIYDPDTGSKYRDTDAAKMALCEFYSVDLTKFTDGEGNVDLDAAVDSITGYDPVKAKELFTSAYAEAIAEGYITDANEDGISDQTVRITYSSSAHSDFIEKTLAYLNEKLAEVLVGTPFEGKIEFVESEPLGNNWSTYLKDGLTDTCLAGWSGSALNPFSLTTLYTNPEQQYDANWFDATTISFSMEIDGEEVTLRLDQWSDALNGTAIEVDEKVYNFGDGMVDVETRLAILAKIETIVLGTYDYIPMLQNAGMSLLTYQVYYVVEEYNAVMGRGGITYLKYNYDDAEWSAFLAENGGELHY